MARLADSIYCRWAAALAATLAMVLAPLAVAAQSGMQVTPDSKRTLINKDIADERWAITRNPDGSVTGNIFFLGGGPPQFISCQELAHAGGEVTLACSGADACPLAPCGADEWAFIAQVAIPETFFGLESGTPFLSVDTPAPLGASGARAATAAENTAAGPAHGTQLTPEGALTLINKDVGGERWAITRNDDGTVTGNVFLPGGGAPQFLWCNEKSAAADVVDLACFGAEACAREAGACRSTDWQFIAPVSLPRSFFEPSDHATMDVVVAAVADSLGDSGGFDAVALALDRGYSLRQVARAGLSGRLRSSGEIVNHSGALEPPAGPPLGLLGTAAGLSAASARSVGFTLDEIRAELKGKADALGTDLLLFLLVLVQEGYPFDQIAEHLFLGGAIGFADPSRPPPFGFPGEPFSLLDEHGKRIPPEKPSDGALVPPQPQPSPTPMATPTPPPSTCGNGDVESGEQCDGLDLDGWSCEAMGFNQGTLHCTSGCRLDPSACSFIPPDGCGNGRIDAHEDCDGLNLDHFTCAEIYAGLDVSGTLGCKSDCTFDTSGCQSCSGEIFCEGSCAPIGSDCCVGEGGWCGPGSVCAGNQTCCPANAPKFCGVGCAAADATCCPSGGGCSPGSVCAGSEKCCPARSPVYCASIDGCIASGPCP